MQNRTDNPTNPYANKPALEQLSLLVADLEQVVAGSQAFAQKLAAAGAPHGLKTQHKAFWQHSYFEIQVFTFHLLELCKVLKPAYNYETPYKSPEFEEWWNKYQMAFLEVHGYAMNEQRANAQLDLLAEYYPKAEDAVEFVKYITARGYFNIFKKNETTNEQTDDKTSSTYEEFQRPTE